MAHSLSGGNAGVALTANAAAAMLFILVTRLGPISGAQMNPPASMIAAWRRDIAWREATAFVPPDCRRYCRRLDHAPSARELVPRLGSPDEIAKRLVPLMLTEAERPGSGPALMKH